MAQQTVMVLSTEAAAFKPDCGLRAVVSTDEKGDILLTVTRIGSGGLAVTGRVRFAAHETEAAAESFSALVLEAGKLGFDGPEPDPEEAWPDIHAINVSLPEGKLPDDLETQIRLITNIGYRRRDNQGPRDFPWASKVIPWRGDGSPDVGGMPKGLQTAEQVGTALAAAVHPLVLGVLNAVALRAGVTAQSPDAGHR